MMIQVHVNEQHTCINSTTFIPLRPSDLESVLHTENENNDSMHFLFECMRGRHVYTTPISQVIVFMNEVLKQKISIDKIQLFCFHDFDFEKFRVLSIKIEGQVQLYVNPDIEIWSKEFSKPSTICSLKFMICTHVLKLIIPPYDRHTVQCQLEYKSFSVK